MSLTLSKEQIEKLRKLDIEMKERLEKEKENKTKREVTSSSTGIPLDIAGLDVIKIGTLFGLIKKKDVFESNTRGNKSLLNILLGEDEEKSPTCPFGYYKASSMIKESEKIKFHQNIVKKECDFFIDMSESFIKKEISEINKLISINLTNNTVECFKTTCLETLDVLIKDLVENYEDEELWLTISLIRNSLLGPLNVCEYKKLISDNIIEMIKIIPKNNYSKIMKHLTTIDKRLSLFNKALLFQEHFLEQSEEEEKNRLIRELDVRCFTKPPELTPFIFKDVTKHICIPSLMYLPIELIIEKCLVGPFRNNSIGFLYDISENKVSSNSGDFYILKHINSDGGRFWSIDQSLERFTNEIIIIMTAYIVNIFKTFFKECFGNNNFFKTKTDFNLTIGCQHQSIFQMLLRNLISISNGNWFHNILTLVLKSKSPLFPTEYDFFNFIKSIYDKRQPFIPIYKPANIVFQTNLKLLFDDFEMKDIENPLFEFIKL
jgi:hypothetical protein